MNRAEFFAVLRRPATGLFGKSLSPNQVSVMDAILDQTEGLPIPHVAYILATAYHEPGPQSRMMPNRENMTYTSAARIAKVWPSRFTVHSAGQFVRNPRGLANKVYNGRLGNRPGTDDGWLYRGAGLDHLTGRAHFDTLSHIVGRDLVNQPEAMLEPTIAVKSLVHGMTTGRYRDLSLSDYGPRGYRGFDYVNARAIVNADVKANGAMIADYARAFEAALLKAGANEPRQMASKPPALPDPAPEPVVVPSRPAPAPVGPKEPVTAPALSIAGALKILLAALAARFGRRA